jgi:ribosomal subunit interface protein
MRIDLRGRPFDVTGALRTHVERRLLFALGRFGTRLAAVQARLDDLNGPRGGIDKRCRLRVRLPGGLHVAIEEVDLDMYVAVDRACERLGRGVARALGRRRVPRARLALARG